MQGPNDISTVICIVNFLFKISEALNFLCLRFRDIVLFREKFAQFIEKCARSQKTGSRRKQHFCQIPLTGQARPVGISEY
jgi:hypothetical protein